MEEIRQFGVPSQFSDAELFEKFHISALKRPWSNSTRHYSSDAYSVLTHNVIYDYLNK
jgi:hypothetical protein